MFHCKDGWWFERLPDGSVAVTKRETAEDDAPIVSLAVFSPNEWASIIASVSATGDVGEQWDRATQFHNRKRVSLGDKAPERE